VFDIVSEVISDMHFDEARDIRIGIGEAAQSLGNEIYCAGSLLTCSITRFKYNDSPVVVINVERGSIESASRQVIDITVEDNGRGHSADELKMFLACSSAALCRAR